MEDDFDTDIGTDGLTPAQRIAMATARHQERRERDIANLARDTPIREAFHQYLKDNGWGFQVRGTPKPGDTYKSSHLDMLWKCFLHATLTERTRNQNDQ